jgi:tRNA (guanine26-N2/guanine27-N2)-dimethyltransferase
VPRATETDAADRPAKKPHAGGGQPATAAGQSVFYNPVQQYNRDLSVIAIQTFAADYVARAATREDRSRRAQRAKKRATRRGSGAEGPAAKRRRVGSAEVAATEGQGRKEDQDKTDEMEEDGDDSFEDGGISDEVLLVAEKSLDGAANGGDKIEGEKMEGTAKEDRRPGINFSILDAFSGTGLRALRYATEVPLATRITANDLSRDAVESIQANIAHNDLPQPGKIRVTLDSASRHMYTAQHKYTVVDLDPYGTAVPFLDAAVQAVADGGLLCVTCTDSAVYNSLGYLEKAHSLYGGVPTKGPHCHEGGLRLVLHAIAAAAGKYGISTEPLLSLSIDFYVRVFVRLRRSAGEVKFLGSKTMLVYSCDAGCGAWTTQALVRSHRQEGRNGAFYKHGPAQGPATAPLCEHCGFKLHLCGPMWGGPLHNPEFVKRMLGTVEALDASVYGTLARAEGMLATALEETELYHFTDAIADADDDAGRSTEPPAQKHPEKDGGATDEPAFFAPLPPQLLDAHPFYLHASALAKVVRVTAPSHVQLTSALRSRGYRCTRSHCRAGGVKTDAPWSAVWEVMRAWAVKTGSGKLREGMAGWRVLKGVRAEPTAGEQEEWEEVEWEEGRAGDAELKVVRGEGAWKVMRRKAAGGEAEGQKGAEAGAKKGQQPIVFDEPPPKKKDPKLVRYQINPAENWGPMRKAKGGAKKGSSPKKE